MLSFACSAAQSLRERYRFVQRFACSRCAILRNAIEVHRTSSYRTSSLWRETAPYRLRCGGWVANLLQQGTQGNSKMSQRDIPTAGAKTPHIEDEVRCVGVGYGERNASRGDALFCLPHFGASPRDADTLWHRIPHTASVGLKHRQVGGIVPSALFYPLTHLYNRIVSCYFFTVTKLVKREV